MRSTLELPLVLNVDVIFQNEKRKTNVEKGKFKRKKPGKELNEELHVILNISDIRSSIENTDIFIILPRYYLMNCEYRKYRSFGGAIAQLVSSSSLAP